MSTFWAINCFRQITATTCELIYMNPPPKWDFFKTKISKLYLYNYLNYTKLRCFYSISNTLGSNCVGNKPLFLSWTNKNSTEAVLEEVYKFHRFDGSSLPKTAAVELKYEVYKICINFKMKLTTEVIRNFNSTKFFDRHLKLFFVDIVLAVNLLQYVPTTSGGRI